MGQGQGSKSDRGHFASQGKKKSLFDAGCVQLDPFLIGLSVCTPCVLCIVCLAANITVSLIAKTARGRNPQTRHLQERGRACEACFVECRLEPAVVATGGLRGLELLIFFVAAIYQVYMFSVTHTRLTECIEHSCLIFHQGYPYFHY